jgi:predicted GNAT family acetyltransferase
VLAHGTYDAFLLLGENDWVKQYISDLLLFSGAIASLYIAIRLSRKLIRLHHLTSQQLFEDANAHASQSIRRRCTADPGTKPAGMAANVCRHSFAGTDSIYVAPDVQRSGLHQQMQDNHHFFIVYNAGIPIGFASYSAVEPHVFKLHKIYILPLQQGRGTGRFVMEQDYRKIKEEGATALRLNVNRNNPALCSFIKSWGLYP